MKLKKWWVLGVVPLVSASAVSCFPISKGITPANVPTPSVIEQPQDETPKPNKPWGETLDGQDNFDKFIPKEFKSANDIPAPSFVFSSITEPKQEVSSVSYFWDYFLNGVFKNKEKRTLSEFREWLEEWSKNGLDKLAIAFSNLNATKNKIFDGYWFTDNENINPKLYTNKDILKSVNEFSYQYQKLVYTTNTGEAINGSYALSSLMPVIQSKIFDFIPKIPGQEEELEKYSKFFVDNVTKRMNNVEYRYPYSMSNKAVDISQRIYKHLNEGGSINYYGDRFTYEFLPNFDMHYSLEKYSAVNKDWAMFHFLARLTDLIRVITDPELNAIFKSDTSSENYYVNLQQFQKALNKIKSNPQNMNQKELIKRYTNLNINILTKEIIKAIEVFYNPLFLIGYETPNPKTLPTKDKYSLIEALQVQDVIEHPLYKHNAVSVEMLDLYNNFLAPLFQMWNQNSYELSNKNNMIIAETRHFLKNLKIKYPNAKIEIDDFEYDTPEYNKQEEKAFEILRDKLYLNKQ